MTTKVDRWLHRRWLSLAFVSAVLAATAGCATYGESVAPIPLPESQADAVSVDGASLIARSYVDPQAARRAFGFDIRGSGLLPVQFVVDNQSGRNLAIQPGHTLLIDEQNNAWPLLSAERAAERVRSNVAAGQSIRSGAQKSLLAGLAGAVAGAAVGVVTGGSVGEAAGKGAAAGGALGAIVGGGSEYASVGRDIQRDLQDHAIQDRLIKPGELAYGFLFFPGRNEAQSTRAVRLALRIGESEHAVTVPVTVMGEGEAAR